LNNSSDSVCAFRLLPTSDLVLAGRSLASCHVSIEAQSSGLVRALSHCRAPLHIERDPFRLDIALFLTAPRCLPQRGRSSLVLRRGVHCVKLSLFKYDAPVAANHDRLSSQVNSPLYMPLCSFSRTAVLLAQAPDALCVQYCVEERTVACNILAPASPSRLRPRPACSGELLCLSVVPLTYHHLAITFVLAAQRRVSVDRRSKLHFLRFGCAAAVSARSRRRQSQVHLTHSVASLLACSLPLC
jgi:hypothetical protein